MKNDRVYKFALKLGALLVLMFAVEMLAQPQPSTSAIPPTKLIQPEELVKLLQSKSAEKPLILNIGPRRIFAQAHIQGSEYIGAGSDAEGIQQLRKRVGSLSKTKSIVLYCGCCPWSRCPNVAPAFQELAAMGFKNVKVLYIADNIGADWVFKGYPTERGE